MKKPRIDDLDEQILELLLNRRQRNDLVGLLGRSDPTVRNHLEKLIRYELVTRSKRGIYQLTSAGREQLAERSLPRLTPTLADPSTQKLIELLPTEGHRALFRLALAGVVAKKHLWKSFRGGWAYFCIAGKTKRFKSALGAVLCKVLYGPEADFHLYSLQSASERELLGRRHVQKGGEVKLAQSPIWKEDFIVLDELDKCRDEAVRRMVLFFCDGRSRFPVEGELVENHVTPFITLNHAGDLKEKLGEPYLRRGIVLNIDSYGDELDGIELRAHEIFAKAEKVRLDLERLCVERAEITKEDRAFLHRLAHDHLNEEGKDLSDTHTLEILVLGRLALLKLKAEVREAIFETLQDYLICAETMGFTQEDWGSRFMERWMECRGQEDPDLRRRYDEYLQRREEREHQRQKREAALVESRLKDIRAEDKFIQRREELLQMIRASRETLSRLRGWEFLTKPLQQRLRHWAKQISKSREMAELRPFDQELCQILQAEVMPLYHDYKRRLQETQAQQDSLMTQEREIRHQIKQIDSEIKKSSRARATFLPYLQRTKSSQNVASQLEKMGLIQRVRRHVLNEETYASAQARMVARFFGRPQPAPEYEPVYAEQYKGIASRYYPLNYFDSWVAAKPVLQAKVDQYDQKITNLQRQRVYLERRLESTRHMKTTLGAQTVPTLLTLPSNAGVSYGQS